MNDTSKQLVEAAEAELDGIDPAVSERVPKAVAAVLRKLADIAQPHWDACDDWPDPSHMRLVADDIEGGGE